MKYISKNTLQHSTLNCPYNQVLLKMSHIFFCAIALCLEAEEHINYSLFIPNLGWLTFFNGHELRKQFYEYCQWYLAQYLMNTLSYCRGNASATCLLCYFVHPEKALYALALTSDSGLLSEYPFLTNGTIFLQPINPESPKDCHEVKKHRTAVNMSTPSPTTGHVICLTSLLLTLPLCKMSF